MSAGIAVAINIVLMAAIADTGFGKWLADNNTQIYGWINPGFNVSTASRAKGGNFPAAYAYDPNLIWLDQAVVLFGRPEAVYAEVATRRPRAAVDEDAFIALRYANGPRVHLWMSAVAAVTVRRRSGLAGHFLLQIRIDRADK